MGNIYISFSAENSSKDSWVKEFMNFFKITIGKISSVPISIDSDLETELNFEKKIDESDLLILVFNDFISDRFSKLLNLIEQRHQEFSTQKKEILIVVKTNKLGSIVPVYLRKYVQFNFFEINIRTNENIEYSPFSEGDKINKFWSKLTDLAYDSKIFIESADSTETQKLTVYLAEVSKDQASTREILRREFLLSGFTILPSKPLPASVKDYQDAVQELIKKSDLSIHIMGELYGDSPAGSDYSFVEIQNKVVSELIGNGFKDQFSRLIWFPPNLEPYDEKQIQYLKRLKRELSDSNKGEIVQCSIEEFKELFNHKIKVAEHYSQQKPDNREKGVLIITDNARKEICRNLENRLININKNYEVIDLSQTGELFPVSTLKQKLMNADKAILLNFTQNRLWIQGMLGLTLKNINHEANPGTISIAAVTPGNYKRPVDFEALKVDFFSLEDSQLLFNIEKFLTQLN